MNLRCEMTNKCTGSPWIPAAAACFELCECISQQAENIHKQFNSKISGMNEELCALQLVRLKTVKDKWNFNICTLKEIKSISGNLKITLFQVK